jgi:predicted SprT family Zn-dependent metalloprotease
MLNDKQVLDWLTRHSHKHWDRLVALYGPRIGACPKIELSKRMTRCYGMAYFEKAVIRFSWSWLANTDARFMFECETIPHEVAHIAAYRIAPDETAHGSTWRSVARRLGIKDTATANYEDYIPKAL